QLIGKILDNCSLMLEYIQICLDLEIISVERAGTWTKKVRDVQYMSMSWRKNDGARAKKIQAEERASVEGWLVSLVKDAIRQIKAGK
ncbi:MAG: hypothetical protein OSJ58_13815, partial [Dysosmobacter sp.]|nr:hypothetical protein [Dysosmobacter sp.]